MFSERTNWTLARNRLSHALEEVRAGGVKIYDLTASNPTRVGLRYDERAILRAMTSARALDYDPQPKGLLEARQVVAEYYRDEHKIVSADPEQIVLTTSTSEGYSFVFRLLCNAGDELLVPKPSYPLFEFLADLQDVKLAPYELIYDHGWQIDFPSLRSAMTERTRGVVVVHPNNPTGSYVQLEERKALNSFCREHGLAVIADEVFLDYRLLDGRLKDHRHEDAPHASFAGNGDVLTFTLSGLSKIAALPQMKVAWVLTSGPQDQAAEAIARMEMIADTYLSMNAPLQWATRVLLEQRKKTQPQLLERVKHNLTELDRQLAAQKACSRLLAEGGWCAVLRIPVTRSDEELSIQLLREKSVLVHPGHFYDFPGDGYLVLSLITPQEDFAAGTRAILDTINS